MLTQFLNVKIVDFDNKHVVIIMAVACVQDQNWANTAVLVRRIGLTKIQTIFGLTSGLAVWSNQNRNYFSQSEFSDV